VLAWLRGERTVHVERERRQRNVTVIDFAHAAHNLFQVTEEWSYTNGQRTSRADVMFLVNGLPVAIVETKGVRRRDAMEAGLAQIRRYHRDTPELMTAPQVFDLTHSSTSTTASPGASTGRTSSTGRTRSRGTSSGRSSASLPASASRLGESVRNSHDHSSPDQPRHL
jgi:type I site-specific restriction-modification system R (restriction) subunit